MKKLFSISQMLLAIVVIISINSCKKESGCTDPAASNYNSNANVDNGTCQYVAGAIFYTDVPLYGTATVSIAGLNPSTAAITPGYYVSPNTSPACGSQGFANYSLILTASTGTSVSYPYSVALNGSSGWANNVTFTGTNCTPVLLPAGGITFYTTNPAYLPITVTINGVSYNVTTFLSGPPSSCGATGCATFSLPFGSYTYNASTAGGGVTWSNTYSITTDGQCVFVGLN